MKKQATIAQQRLFFDLATLTIVRSLRYESNFLCFCFYQFFHKKWFKTQPKTEARKTIRKWCPWGLQIIPKSLKTRCFPPPKTQICCKTSVFWTVDFWVIFWVTSFQYFRQFGDPKWVPKRKDAGHFSILFSQEVGFFKLVAFLAIFCSQHDGK